MTDKREISSVSVTVAQTNALVVLDWAIWRPEGPTTMRRMVRQRRAHLAYDEPLSIPQLTALVSRGALWALGNQRGTAALPRPQHWHEIGGALPVPPSGGEGGESRAASQG